MAEAKKSYIVDEDGRRTAIVLPIEEYHELLEDIEGLAIIAEQRGEPTEPLEVVMERLERKWDPATELS